MAKTNAERQKAYRSLRNGRNGGCAECAALRNEVEALKRQQAGRGSPGEQPARLEAGELAASQNASKATVTPHGPQCQCIFCLQGAR